jgi:hypothetical protein
MEGLHLVLCLREMMLFEDLMACCFGIAFRFGNSEESWRKLCPCKEYLVLRLCRLVWIRIGKRGGKEGKGRLGSFYVFG